MAASDPASAGKAGLTVRDTAADNLIQDGRGTIVYHAFLASGNKSRHTCRLRAGCANISALLKMKHDGATRCHLEVRQSNAVARRLYEGNGFKLDGIRKSYYPTEGGREDALLMSRCL